MKITGILEHVTDIVTISQTFEKRDIVIKTNEKYPQEIIVQLSNDKINELSGLRLGDLVEVKINIRGRKWVSPQGEIKYFNTIEGWKIERFNNTNNAQPYTNVATPAQRTSTAAQNYAPINNIVGKDDEEVYDDLPF